MQDLTIYDNERRYVFTNATKEDFIGTWAGVDTLIKAGESIEVPQYKAYHFTKHLVDREMFKNRQDSSVSSPEARKLYEDQYCMEISAGTDSPALAKIKEKIKEEVEAEATGKKKKITPKDAKKAKVVVKEFEDLQ